MAYHDSDHDFVNRLNRLGAVGALKRGRYQRRDNLHVGDFKVDPDRLAELLGFEPADSLRLPLDPIRNVIFAAAGTWLDLQARVRRKIWDPTPKDVREASADVRSALANLYVHLATYDARRCPAPIPPRYPLIRELFIGLIEEIHLAIPGAPPLDTVVVFVGRDLPEDEQNSGALIERQWRMD